MNNLIKKEARTAPAIPWTNDFFDVENIFSRNMWPDKWVFPAVNVLENNSAFGVEVVAPGFKKEDFKINIDEENVLTIRAEQQNKTEENGDEYNRREYSYSSFTRSFYLPENAKNDSISAKYADGILKLDIPKTEAKKKAKLLKEIQVK